MKILRRRIRNTIPVWLVLSVVLVGTTAGAFLWISNLIETTPTVTDVPIELQEEYMSPTYVDEYVAWIIDYTIHDASQCDGYIYIEISAGFALSTSEVNVVDLQVDPELGTSIYGSLVSGYPQNPASNIIVFVYEDTFGGPFDFDDLGSSSAGEIRVTLLFTVAGDYLMRLQISSSAS
ncbi:MAG: hypothetical protein KAR33_08740 [Candidatus Thorarchaeota archaeon]|nr:hypothetical protein [Candidatus Thorarchaeota archaeon]